MPFPQSPGNGHPPQAAPAEQYPNKPLVFKVFGQEKHTDSAQEHREQSRSDQNSPKAAAQPRVSCSLLLS